MEFLSEPPCKDFFNFAKKIFLDICLEIMFAACCVIFHYYKKCKVKYAFVLLKSLLLSNPNDNALNVFNYETSKLLIIYKYVRT